MMTDVGEAAKAATPDALALWNLHETPPRIGGQMAVRPGFAVGSRPVRRYCGSGVPAGSSGLCNAAFREACLIGRANGWGMP
jgi:hypothetical protein